MQKQISIIIPTYNMEEYIGKCLDSLIIPDFDKVEVLVVNDGSKDCSSEIAHSYADRYPNSIRVIDKENGNYGSCINVALPLATGRYIKVLDADDTFDTNSFKIFVDRLQYAKEDVVFTKMTTIDTNGNKIRTFARFQKGSEFETIVTLDEARQTLSNVFIQMHTVTYNADVFKRFKYKQIEGISYTDLQWVIQPISYCKTFRSINISLYLYLIGREGQTTDLTQIRKSTTHYSKLIKGILEFYSSVDSSEADYDILRSQIILNTNMIYLFMLRHVNEDSARFFKDMDLYIASDFPWLYDATGSIVYSENYKYEIIKDLRRKNYPIGYKVPFYVKVINRSIQLFKDLLHNK